MKHNNNFFVILLVLRIFLQFSPALETRTSLMINFPILVALYLYIFLNLDKGVFIKSIKTIPIFIVLVLNHIAASTGEIQLINIIYIILQWLIWPFSGFFIINRLSIKSQKIFFWSFLICFIITSITTIYGCITFPSAARLLANGNFVVENADLVAIYRGMNIGDFQFVYTLVLIIPVVLCVCRNYLRHKIAGYFILALFLYTIYKTQYTTALLLSIAAVSFLIIPATHYSRRPVAWLASFIVIAVIASPLFSGVLLYVSSAFQGEVLTERLSELSMYVGGRDLDESTDYGTRLSLWGLSLDTFLKYFFTGVYFVTKRSQAYMYIGGHSFILDTMARFGIVGFLLLIWMFMTLYKLYIKPYRQRPEYIYILVVYAINIVQCLLNTLSIVIVFVFLIPLLLSVTSQRSYMKDLLKPS